MDANINIIPVNIAPLEKEIAEAEAAVKEARDKITYWENILAQKQTIRNYIIHQGGNKKNGSNSTAIGVFAEPAPKLEIAESDIGISGFILRELFKGDKTTKVLSEEFAKQRSKDYDVARNNISNALSRLRDSGQIDRRFKRGSKAATWFLLNKEG
jgi:hypothetical protein